MVAPFCARTQALGSSAWRVDEARRLFSASHARRRGDAPVEIYFGVDGRQQLFV
jgi:hypothetical protein